VKRTFALRGHGSAPDDPTKIARRAMSVQILSNAAQLYEKNRGIMDV